MPADLTELRDLAALASLLRRRRVSATELVRASLARLETTGRELNAVASTLRRRALAEAQAADRLIARGGSRSPLVGIPFGIKDNVAAVGAPLTVGSALYRRHRPRSDATAVARLRDAGAIPVAKLALIELAGASGMFGGPAASLQGPARNPWDPDRWAGGSSGGSAAAVAAGLVPFAIGSETGGSMALPAAFCGVTAVRPSYGVVSRHGVVPLSWTLDKIGPMANTARDCALVLEAIAGPDPRDPTHSGQGFRRLRGRAAAEAVRRLRVGVIEVPDAEIPDPRARRALARGIDDFLRLVGRTHVRVDLPVFPYDAMVTTIYSAEGAAIYGHDTAGARLRLIRDPLQRAGLRAAMRITAYDYLQAMRARALVIAAFDEIFRRVDVLLCIGRTRTATPLVPGASRRGTPAELRARAGTVPIVLAGNLAGLPSVYFPCGTGDGGLPVGLQLAGRAYSEHLLLAAVEAFQAGTPPLPAPPAGHTVHGATAL